MLFVFGSGFSVKVLVFHVMYALCHYWFNMHLVWRVAMCIVFLLYDHVFVSFSVVSLPLGAVGLSVYWNHYTSFWPSPPLAYTGACIFSLKFYFFFV